MTSRTKKGYSYLELIVVMLFVAVILFISTPMLTKTAKKTDSVYGEFRCFYACLDKFEGCALYQQHRYNTDSLSEPKVAEGGQCVFTRPTGAKIFNITVIGAGGGGSMPYFDDSIKITDTNSSESLPADLKDSSYSLTNSGDLSTLVDKLKKADNANQNIPTNYLNNMAQQASSRVNCDSSGCFVKAILDDGSTNSLSTNSYNFSSKKRSIAFYKANGGKAGEIKTATSTLASDFQNNKLTIKVCQNPNITTSDIDSFCVGEPGQAGTAGSRACYNIGVPVMQDYLIAKYSRPNTLTNGDKLFNSFDIARLKQVADSTNFTDSMLNSAISSSIGYNNSIFYNNLSKLINGESGYCKELENEYSGQLGGYSRFKTADGQDIVALGGEGGVSSLANGVNEVYSGNTAIEQTVSKVGSSYYYLLKGENGAYNSKYADGSSYSTSGQGGLCKANNGHIDDDNNDGNCNGVTPNIPGAGGGGGSIGFKASAEILFNYIATIFNYAGRELYSMYNITPLKEDIEIPELCLNGGSCTKNIVRGKGGDGAGGAIIITW